MTGFRAVVLIFCTLVILGNPALAWGDRDASGSWESTYDFGPEKEIMTAKIQQVENNILGSFSVVVEPSGDEYSGIIFGTVEDDRVNAYYLSVRNLGEDDPLVSITFADGRLIDDETIKGTVYYQDSNFNEIPPFDYKATKI
ncbi:hypothetical protein D4R47_04495 [archaeon]|nr:MAG: hypothetical protein D4R47_04495 [archaeon]